MQGMPVIVECFLPPPPERIFSLFTFTLRIFSPSRFYPAAAFAADRRSLHFHLRLTLSVRLFRARSSETGITLTISFFLLLVWFCSTLACSSLERVFFSYPFPSNRPPFFPCFLILCSPPPLRSRKHFPPILKYLQLKYLKFPFSRLLRSELISYLPLHAFLHSLFCPAFRSLPRPPLQTSGHQIQSSQFPGAIAHAHVKPLAALP